jgi:hypothetical protein
MGRGVMGRETVPQLHFDGEPGTAAAGTNGQPVLGSLVHKIVPPGCCQLVQFGNTKVVPALGQTILLIATVTNCLVPSALVVSPQLSVGVLVSNSW